MATRNQKSGSDGEKPVAKSQVCPSCKKKQTLRTLPQNFIGRQSRYMAARSRLCLQSQPTRKGWSWREDGLSRWPVSRPQALSLKLLRVILSLCSHVAYWSLKKSSSRRAVLPRLVTRHFAQAPRVSTIFKRIEYEYNLLPRSNIRC